MKNGFLKLLVASLSLLPFAVPAEPTNLAKVKQELIAYHDSGAYRKELNATITEATQYLKTRLAEPMPNGKKPAIVLDIDETSLSNYDDMRKLDFGGTLDQIRMDEDKGLDPAIPATLRLYQYAKTHHVAVFFLTGRLEESRKTTERNLQNVGYDKWNGLILRSEDYRTAPAAAYKIAMRKQITDLGYHIILNIGDQESDLVGNYAEKTFKLPNPYYYIP